MIQIRKSADRGHFDHGWLDTRHTFSFADYHDPEQMGFRNLRVINEDRVSPGQGFGTHGHRDMEIISVVVSGNLSHKDSMGNGSALKAGDIQRMTAGTGVTHSEFNGSDEEPLHFLQIWVLPEQAGLAPGYQEIHVTDDDKRGRLLKVAAKAGGEGVVKIHQDVEMYASLLEPGQEVTHDLRPGRHAWAQVVQGEIEVNGTLLRAGDGAAISDETALRIRSGSGGEWLLFDLN
jgi:redox-sensitive bicupin YhaK (pirin superfamily)